MPFEPSREGQLTEENLKWGYWWTLNKVRVRKVVSIVLAILDVVLVGYGTFGFADWFFGSGVRERQAIAQLARPVIDYGYFRTRDAPDTLRVEPVQVLSAGSGVHDLVARVQNPNDDWIATFEYRFSGPGLEGLPAYRGYILPGETRWVDALGIRTGSALGAAGLSIENLSWRRVDPHVVQPDYATWAAARLQLTVRDAVFATPTVGDAVPVSRARFTVTNDTGFGYRDVTFLVTLYSGSRVVGVNRVSISNLRPGETRPVSASWFNELPTVTRVEAQPVIDIFDSNAYLAPGQ